MLGQETKDSYPGIWLTSKNSNTGRAGFWFCLELPNETNDMVKGYLYAGDDETETDQPLAVIADGVRNEDDESKRVLWAADSSIHINEFEFLLKKNGFTLYKKYENYYKQGIVEYAFNGLLPEKQNNCRMSQNVV